MLADPVRAGIHQRGDLGDIGMPLAFARPGR
jgi:hypothetical protein